MLDHVLLRLRQLEERVTALESKSNSVVPPADRVEARRSVTPPPLPVGASSNEPVAMGWIAGPPPLSLSLQPQPPRPPQPLSPPPPSAEAGPSLLPTPAPHPTQPEPSAALQGPQRSDLEHFVGLTVLGRVGAAALLLAAAYFGQLGWSRLGPEGRVALVYGAGLAMVAIGFLLRAKVSTYYTAVLWGSGTALTYVAGSLASLSYELVTGLPAMLLLFGSAALGQWLARVLRLEAFATVALAGAYAAPVLVGSPAPTPTAFFVLLLSLHSWAAWTERTWSWHVARALAVVATVVLATGWYLQNGRVSTVSFVLHLEALALGLAAPELLAAFVRGQVVRWRWPLVVLGISFVHAVLLGHTWWHEEWTGFGLTAGAVWLAAGAYLAPKSASLACGVARLGSVLLAAGALQVWQGVDWPLDASGEVWASAQVWAHAASLGAATVGLLSLRRWILVGELGASLAALLAVGLVVLQGPPTNESRLQAIAVLTLPMLLLCQARPWPAAAVGLVLGCGTAFFGLCQRLQFGGEGSHWLPIAFAAAGAVATFGGVQAGRRRERPLLALVVTLLAVLAFGWAALVMGAPVEVDSVGSLKPFWNVRFASMLVLMGCLIAGSRAMPRDETVALAVLRVAMLTVGYLGGLVELLEVIRGCSGGWRDVATSLYTLAFAGGLLLAGFVKQNAKLRWAGLVGFGIVVTKLAVHDLRTLESPLRVLATGVLGLAMLLGAYAYARNRGRAA